MMAAPFQFPSNNSDLHSAKGEPEGREYIQHLLVVAADDAKNVILLATVAIAAVVLLVKDLTKSIHEMSPLWRGLAVAAASMLVIAAMLLYVYAAKVNHRRMDIIRCLTTNDAEHAHDLWAGAQSGIAATHGWWLNTGCFLLGLGAAGALVLVWVLVF